MRLNILRPDAVSTAPHIIAGGRRWSLAAQDVDESSGFSADNDFVCVSYSWGLGRVPSPLRPDFPVSDRTLPALEAVVRQRDSGSNAGVWIDALCVPPLEDPQARAATLESMGFIYSRAAEVVVVLSPSARAALEHVKHSLAEPLPRQHLDDMEREEWTSRAWTYQEAVNAQRLRLTCEQAPEGLAVEAMDFFNSLSYTLQKMVSAEERKERYPRLDTLEDVMLDYATADYLERSALQIMAIMDRRSKTRAEDHFYAMIGAITTSPASSAGDRSPCEAFMALCEQKGDYSFVYSAADRDLTATGRAWRPVAGSQLPAIMRLPAWGNGQPGHFDDSGDFYLDDMVVLEVAELEEDALKFVNAWLARSDSGYRWKGLPADRAAYAALRGYGFPGDFDLVSTKRGYFFPASPLHPAGETSVLVTCALRWTLGAPSLARQRIDGSTSYVPGILFGKIDQDVGNSSASVKM